MGRVAVLIEREGNGMTTEGASMPLIWESQAEGFIPKASAV
jgi:hypothetical protein